MRVARVPLFFKEDEFLTTTSWIFRSVDEFIAPSRKRLPPRPSTPTSTHFTERRAMQEFQSKWIHRDLSVGAIVTRILQLHAKPSVDGFSELGMAVVDLQDIFNTWVWKGQIIWYLVPPNSSLYSGTTLPFLRWASNSAFPINHGLVEWVPAIREDDTAQIHVERSVSEARSATYYPRESIIVSIVCDGE